MHRALVLTGCGPERLEEHRSSRHIQDERALRQRAEVASVGARDRKVIEAELGYKPMNIFIGR